MRLTKKKVEEILLEIIGGEGLPLVQALYERQNISEFELARETKKDIKVIRRLLYILYNNNLVYFSRKKDKDKGWYIYYWTLSPENIRFLYYKKKRERLTRLLEQLEREQKELFFTCPKRCVRLTFDQAMDFDFHCPECGELVQHDNSLDKVGLLKQQIAGLYTELKEEKMEKKSKPGRKLSRPPKSKKKIKRATKRK